MAERLAVDPENPDSAVIERAAEALARGRLVVFPTQGLYGLGADAMNPDAVARVFRAKKRAPDKPVLILVEGSDSAASLAREVPAAALRLMEEFWPGRLTIVLPATDEVPALLCAGTGTVGLRAAGHPVARALVAAFGGPLTGTSANPAGAPAPASVEDLDPQMEAAADLILDAGRLSGEPSTVAAATGGEILILRAGAVTAERIAAVLKGVR